MKHVRRTPRGIFIPDLLVALFMVTVLLMAMTSAISAVYRGEKRLAESRALFRRLETNLMSLQSGGTPDTDVALERLPDAAPAGRVWVRLTVRGGRDGPGHALVGLAPAGGAP